MALFTKSSGFANSIGSMQEKDGWGYSDGSALNITTEMGGANNRVTFILDDGRVACANGDWIDFKSRDDAGNWEFALTVDEDTRARGYNYLSLGGRWLCVDGSGALNLKGSGSYVFYESFYGH